jgi:hypothetical protein
LQAGVSVWREGFTGLLRQFEILANFLAVAQIAQRDFLSRQFVIMLHATLKHLERRNPAFFVEVPAGFAFAELLLHFSRGAPTIFICGRHSWMAPRRQGRSCCDLGLSRSAAFQIAPHGPPDDCGARHVIVPRYGLGQGSQFRRHQNRDLDASTSMAGFRLAHPTFSKKD